MNKPYVIALLLFYQLLCAQDLVPYRQGEFFGYTDVKGNWKIQPTFDRAGWFQEGLAPVATGCNDCWDVYDGKWGFINAQGKEVIPFQFEHAGEFSEGLAPVMLGNAWGYIQTNGSWVIKPMFLEARQFSQEVAWVQDQSEKWGIIGKDGSWILEPVYNAIGISSEGLTPVLSIDEWGYSSPSGATVISLQYSAATPFYKGRAVVQKGGKYFLIDTKGKVIKESFEAEFSWYSDPYDLKAMLCPQSGEDPVTEWKLMHFSGKEIVPCGGYQSIRVRNNQWAYVTNWKDGGWMNAEGKLYADYPKVDILRPLISYELPELPTDALKDDDATYRLRIKVRQDMANTMELSYLVFADFTGNRTSIIEHVPLTHMNTDEGLDMFDGRPLIFEGYVNSATLKQLILLDQSSQGRFLYAIHSNLPSKRLLDQAYFRLFAQGTVLIDDSVTFFNNFRNGMADLLREPFLSDLKKSMLDVLHSRGKTLETLPKENPVLVHSDPSINGKRLSVVMQNASVQLLDMFVEYLVSQPAKYAGTRESLAIIFKDWLTTGK